MTKLKPIILLAGSFVCSPVFADTLSSRDASLAAIAVHIDQTPKQSWPGYGVYLGNGYVLTAAHVAGSSVFSNPHVVIAGKSFSAQTVRQGTFEGDDLTLLQVDDTQLPQALRTAHVVLCEAEPPLGSSVVVSTPEGVAISHIVAPRVLSSNVLAHYPTLIGDVASTGNSGSGVFDQKTHCLLGIISRKISLRGIASENGQKVPKTVDIAKYFVPFGAIRAAISPDVKF